MWVSKLVICLQKKPGCTQRQIINILDDITNKNLVLHTYGDIKNYLKEFGQKSLLFTDKEWDDAELILDKSAYMGITVINYLDNSYPPTLRDLQEPAPIIFLRGNTSVLRALPGVAIVGTRKVSNKGEIIAKRLGEYFSKNEWVVVSGLALGVDAAVHQGVVDSGGKTIAVLAGGLHQATPKKNALLAQQILDTNGAWVSEYPVGVHPQKVNFVRRNRIQVALSAGSIIVEAEEKSGSITQAKYCMQMKRPLFSVVPADERNSLGLNCTANLRLVAEGNSLPIISKDDYPNIINALNKYKDNLRSKYFSK